MTLNVNLNLALETAPDVAAGRGAFERSARRTCRPIHPGRLARARSRRRRRAARRCCRPAAAIRARSAISTPANFPPRPPPIPTSSSCSACSKRVADVENLFTHLRFCKQDIVLSYCATDLGGERSGFANALSFYDLALLFDRYGFRIECTAPVDAAPAADAAHPDRPAQAGRRLQRRSDLRRRRQHLRRPARLAEDQCAAAGRSRRAAFEFRCARRGARQIRPGGARHRRRPVPAAHRRRGARYRLARQGGDRHFRHAIPRVDPARRPRAVDRTARHLVRPPPGRRAACTGAGAAMWCISATG